MSDNKTTIQELKSLIEAFVDARDWQQFHSPKNLSMSLSIEAAELMARKAAALFEAGVECGAEANISKHLAAEAAWKMGEACMQTFGGFAYAREYDIERKWRECRLYRTAPISTNLILSYIGQHVLGMPRSF